MVDYAVFSFSWFKSGKDQHTGKETWLFTGEYWDRNWQKSPDIF